MPYYDQLHVFIDESGDFINYVSGDTLLVGGVFFWGEYSASINNSIRKILLAAMHEQYDHECRQADNNDYDDEEGDSEFYRRSKGKRSKNRKVDKGRRSQIREVRVRYSCVDYAHLHYHYSARFRGVGSFRYWKEKNQFITYARQRLSHELYLDRLEGFFIRYEKETDADSKGDSTDKTSFDCRYERMLKRLAENIIYRALYTGENRLSPNGTLYFHIGERIAVEYFSSAEERERIIQNELAPRGIRAGVDVRQYVVDEENGTISVKMPLDTDRFKDKVNQIIGAYNSNLSCEVDPQKILYPNYVKKLERNPNEYIPENQVILSDMGFYLADIFLGQIRNKRDPSELIVANTPRYNHWVYVSTAAFINDVKIDLSRGSNELFWNFVVEHPEQANDNVLFSFLKDISVDGANLLLKGFQGAFKRVREKVDNPGLGGLIHAKQTYDALTAIYMVLNKKSSLPSPQEAYDSLELVNSLIKVTLANHYGRVCEGLKFIDEYRKIIANRKRNVFEAFSLEEELEFRTEMALRCAVTYADQFDYVNATNLIEEAREQQENACETFKDLATKLNLSPRKTPLLLGRCYSSLGQYQAFQGNFAAAVEQFDKAIAIFDAYGSPGDVEYDLIFEGHVACDMARSAQNANDRAGADNLWKTVANKLSFPTLDALIVPSSGETERCEFAPIVQNNRYTLALFLKAMAFFASDQEIRQFLDKCNENALFDGLRTGAFEHPYELILPAIGVLYEKLFSSSHSLDDRARAMGYYFDGYNIAKSGGVIIRVLSMTSLARRHMLTDASLDEWRAWNTELEALLALFKPECVDAVFGADRGAIAEGEEFATSEEYRAKAERFIQAIRFNYW